MQSVPPNSLVLYEDVNVKVLNKQDRERANVDFQI
jgi:hypothetical protein